MLSSIWNKLIVGVIVARAACLFPLR